MEYWNGLLEGMYSSSSSSKEAFRIAFHYSSGSIPVVQCSILIIQYIESEWCHKQLSVTKRGKPGEFYSDHTSLH